MEVKFSHDVVPLTDLKAHTRPLGETCGGITPAGVAD